MARKTAVSIKMLGGFSIAADGGEQKRADVSSRARRLWSIVAYLTVFRARGISTDELIETFWSDRAGENPLSTLQNNISRARSTLAAMGLPRDLIVTVSGRYCVNPAFDVTLDAECFERLCRAQRAQEQPDPDSALAAIELYGGDFLSGLQDDWIGPLRTYYRTLYTELCRAAVRQLWELGRWTDTVRVCEAAYRVQPDIEAFSVYFMRALTALDQARRALEHYETVKRMLLDEYGLMPSDELELARSEAAQRLTGGALDFETALGFIREQPDQEGAYLCDYGTFRHIVRLQSRLLARSGEQIQLMVVELEQRGRDFPSTDMKRLERTLMTSLRAGDPFARLSATQFILLLPSATRENAATVMGRIESNFRRAYPRSRARLNDKILPLDPSPALEGTSCPEQRI